MSPEVGQRLSSELDRPVRLRPDEWQSGEIRWIIDIVGEQKAIQILVEKLRESLKPHQSMKIRRIGPDNVAEVVTLHSKQAVESAQS